MDFKEYIRGELEKDISKCSQTAYILNSFRQVCTEEKDVIQYIQLHKLLMIKNFIDLLIAALSRKDKRLVADAIETIAAEYDKNEISSHVYSYFIYCVLAGVDFQTDTVYWIDPREERTGDVSWSQNMPTFGLGTFVNKIDDFSIRNSVLETVRANRSMLSVPIGVREITANAFRNCKAQIVTLPNSVQKLNPYGLSELKNLEIVILPPHIEEIPEGFFKNSPKLSMVVANGVKRIGKSAFENTAVSGLSRICGTNLEFVAENAFRNCKSLKTIDLLKTHADPSVLCGCDALQSVAVSVTPEVKKLAAFFGNFARNERLHIEKIKIKFENETVPEGFFENCTALKEVEFIGHIKAIGERAFKNCTALSNISGEIGAEQVAEETFLNCSSLGALSLKACTKIGEKAFAACRSLQKLSFERDIQELGTYAFAGCEELSELNMNFVGKRLPENCFVKCGKLKIGGLIGNVKILDSRSLASVSIDEAFVFPAGLELIERDAFEGAETHIASLSLPSGLHFEKGALKGLKVTNITFSDLQMRDPNGDLILPYMLFADSLEEFNRDSTIRNVKIQTSDICNHAFGGWKNLEKVLFSAEVSKIPNDCFEGCTSLVGVKLVSDKVKVSIGDRAFYNCAALERIAVGEGEKDRLTLNRFQKIGKQAFAYCSSLQRIYSSVPQTFEKAAFEGCTKVNSLTVAVGGEMNGYVLADLFGCAPAEFATRYDTLGEVTVFSDGAIPQDFFKEASQLKSIKVIGEVRVLGKSAFENCRSLDRLEIDFKGTELPERCFCNDEAVGSFAPFENVRVIGEKCFENCGSVKELEFGSPLEQIGGSAFGGCIGLKELRATVACKKIEDKTFYRCEALESIVLSQTVSIETTAFLDCFALGTLRIGALGFGTLAPIFGDLPALKSIIFDGETIPNSYFRGLDKLEQVVFTNAEKIKRIGSFAFENCTSLRSLGQLDHVQSVCSYAFANTPIKEYTIPRSAEYLGVGIFAGCLELTRLSLPLKIEQFGMLFSREQREGLRALCQSGRASDRIYYIPVSLKCVEITYFGCEEGGLSGLDLEKLVFACEVKQVPDHCFYNCSCDLDISLDKVERFGAHSFEGTGVRISSLNSAVSVGSCAFKDCTSSKTVRIGPNAADIDFSCFLDTDVLSIEVDRQNKRYKKEGGFVILEDHDRLCFADKTLSGKVVVPKHIGSVDPYVFRNCTEVNEIVIPERVEYLGEYAFEGCSSLKALTVPFIGPKKSQPQTLDHLFHGTKFREPFSLKVCGGDVSFGFNGIYSEFDVLDLHGTRLTSIGERMFNGLQINELRLPPHAVIAAERSFEKCKIKRLEADSITHDGGVIYVGDKLYYCYDPTVKNLVVGDEIASVVKDAFENIEVLESVTIKSAGLRTNGAFAHIKIGALELVRLSNGVSLLEEFGNAADSLTKLVYHGKKAGGNLLQGMKAIKSYDMNELETVPNEFFDVPVETPIERLSLRSARTVGKGWLKAGTRLSELIFGDELEELPLDSLTGVDIGNVQFGSRCIYKNCGGFIVNSLTQELLYACKKQYEKITVPNGIKTIKAYAFRNCEANAVFTNQTEIIEEYAFASMKGRVEQAVVEDCVKRIGEGVFADTEVMKLRIPFVGETQDAAEADENADGAEIAYLFRDKEKNNETPRMKKLVVTSQRKYAKTFANCLAEEIVISRNAIAIGGACFKNCVNLTEFVIPKTVQTVGDFAFQGCSPQLTIFMSVDPKSNPGWGKKFNVVAPRNFVRKVFTFGTSKDERAQIVVSAQKEGSYEL